MRAGVSDTARAPDRPSSGQYGAPRGGQAMTRPARPIRRHDATARAAYGGCPNHFRNSPRPRSSTPSPAASTSCSPSGTCSPAVHGPAGTRDKGDRRPQSQIQRQPPPPLGGCWQGLQVRRAEVCGAKVKAPPEQLFHILLVPVGIELGDTCAERGGDRRAGQVEPRGYLMGQQVRRRVQRVSSRGRVRLRGAAGLQCGERVTRAAPPRPEADVSELAEGPAEHGQAPPAGGLQPAGGASGSSHVLHACCAGRLDAVGAGTAGLLEHASHAGHRVIGVLQP